ncbi:WG repeat-containing protein [Pedobacter caeni]|uniref:WG containing repeat-containing protein n=1 Tax=Pedobacter caeni TaxID=288992 RepID=A0A1M5AVA0_9SPHI|nr:WG repeat-containing protein [Pedobacter caeni]SHF34179.1 WG containing repeat-containing protein [Pedobacter caeni]
MTSTIKYLFLFIPFLPLFLYSQNKKDYKTLFNQLSFESASPFHEKRALVCIDDYYQYIDEKGNLLPFKFKRTSEFPGFFVNGRAKIYTKSGKYGYINPSGKLAIDTIYRVAAEFSDSLVFVARKGFYGFIDVNGKEMLPVDRKYMVTLPFKNGVAVVSDGKKYGAINKKGALIISLDFDEIEAFEEGFAIARKTREGLSGVIDATGKFVVEPKYSVLASISEGLIAFCDESEKWGFIDLKGNVVIKPKYSNVGDFHEGMAYVENEDSKVGYIDRKGKQIIDFKFDTALDFSEGLAVATVEIKKNGFTRKLSGYIDKKGDWVFLPAFPEANLFSEGKALILEMSESHHLRWIYITKP